MFVKQEQFLLILYIITLYDILFLFFSLFIITTEYQKSYVQQKYLSDFVFEKLLILVSLSDV